MSVDAIAINSGTFSWGTSDGKTLKKYVNLYLLLFLHIHSDTLYSNLIQSGMFFVVQ